jgi:hypothetical protein
VQLERNTKFNPKNRKHDYLLTSLIKCTCGANRNGDGPAGKKYYRCTSRNRTHPIKNHCTVGGINVTVADGLVWNELSNVMANPKLIRKHAEEWLKRQKASNTVTNALSMKSRLSELENEQKRYVDAYGKGFMPEALFAEKIKETNRQIEALKIDIAKASENRGVAGKIDVEQLVQKAALKLGNLNFDQKKHIVERVVDKIIASPKEIIIWGLIRFSACTHRRGR